MGYPRKSLICLEDTAYYHVVARCVRRAWLWGYDTYAGKDYSHRKAWVLRRLRCLADIFAIDLCAYAIMSNHYHLVLRVDRPRVVCWSHAEVVTRWTQLFRVCVSGLGPEVLDFYVQYRRHGFTAGLRKIWEHPEATTSEKS